MTDKEILFSYRLNLTDETIRDAEKMAKNNLSPRSIINRSYYSVFYIVLALFIKAGLRVKTSKHTGIISIFDKEFVKTKKIDKSNSAILHKLFNFRQESDYKDLLQVTMEEAKESIKNAKILISKIKEYINNL